VAPATRVGASTPAGPATRGSSEIPALAPEALAQAAQAAQAGPAYGLRRPLVGREGRVEGFELQHAAGVAGRLGERVDDPAAVTAAALVGAARLAAAGGRLGLVSLPGPLLDRKGVQQQAGAGVWIAWRGESPAAASVAALRARGARIGAPDGPPERLGGPAGVAPDFVLLRASAGGQDTLLLSAQRWSEAFPKVPRVATGLGGIDEVERMLRAGFALAGGRLDGPPAAAGPRTLDAAAHRICQLLNHLALDRDTAVVAEAVRADVALGYRLLRYANSPAIGLARGVDKIEQAVMVLGRAELQRWLAMMLLDGATRRPAAAALQEHALALGRLFEMLARRRSEPDPAALFTVGLLSRLDLLLQAPLAAVLEPLRLSDAARDALLARRGPWAGYLEVAAVLEGDDEAALAVAAAPFGGAPVVLDAARDAWGWAAEVAGHGG
jgi:EAL and modified HD-GYP domain-containing signal transduction protein